MPASPTPTSVTLSNGAVVRVGDVVPMTDGTIALVLDIDPDGAEIRLAGDPVAFWLAIDDDTLNFRDRARINLAALASQASGGEREALRALVAKWRAEADAARDEAGRAGGAGFEKPWQAKAETFDECAAALEALAGKGEG